MNGKPNPASNRRNQPRPERNKKTANAVVYATLKSAHEILGSEQMEILLRQNGLGFLVNNYPPDNTDLGVATETYARIIQAIESQSDGQSILYEIGRRTFRHTQAQHAGVYKLAGAALRFMPRNMALNAVLAAIVNALTTTNPTVVAWHERAHNSPNGFLYAEATCAMCYGRTADEPVCTMYNGFLSEAAFWATGVQHSVIEVRCIAQGDTACEFLIEPIE